MPVTFYTIIIAAISVFSAAYFINRRLKTSPSGGSNQVRHLRNYFFYIGIFMLIFALPELSLIINPSRFSMLMAWGYVIGHIFAYLALIEILLLTLSLSPRLNKLQKPAAVIIALLAVVTTIVNAKTMGFGVQPQYDYVNHVVIFNAAPIVGALIGILGSVCMLPAIILFFYNAVTNPAARTRSFLLGIGLFGTIMGGLMQDNSRTWQLYLVGDILMIFAYSIVATAVLYRFEERMAPSRDIVSANSAS